MCKQDGVVITLKEAAFRCEIEDIGYKWSCMGREVVEKVPGKGGGTTKAEIMTRGVADVLSLSPFPVTMAVAQ